MTRQEVAALVIKTLALVLLVWGAERLAIILFSALAFAWKLKEIDPTMLSGLGYCFPFVFLGVVFWLKAEAVGRRMVSDDTTPVTSGAPFQHWLSLALIVLGVYLLATAIPSLAYQVLLAWKPPPGYSEYVKMPDAPVVVAQLCKIVIGLFLIFGARGIGRLIMRFRTIGLENKRSDQSPHP